MKRHLLAASLLAASPLLGQEPRLGTIVFPTSGAPTAQPAFIRGVLYLHSFEYAQAATAFRDAERLDPGFAMAYWGEALTYTHPVWNQQNLDSGRMALAKLTPRSAERVARAPTPRERGYLDAVQTLYGEGSKERRDTLYSRAMVELMEDFPDDAEARCFAALSIIGLTQGVRDVGAYMRAAAMVAPVFAANPDHPGAAHYLIHAFDDPLHAPLGLSAARAYIRIAPDAAHAQHMTTHIFLALGMWDETIAQNVIATNQTAYVPGHYTEWLGYGYLQAGRFADSRALLGRVRDNITGARQRAELALMRAQHVVNAEEWASDLWSWPVDASAAPLLAAVDRFARGFAAVRRSDTVAARAALAELSGWSRGRRGRGCSAGGLRATGHRETGPRADRRDAAPARAARRGEARVHEGARARAGAGALAHRTRPRRRSRGRSLGGLRDVQGPGDELACRRRRSGSARGVATARGAVGISDIALTVRARCSAF